jgi:uncharacterized protein (TIGR02594 family)
MQTASANEHQPAELQATDKTLVKPKDVWDKLDILGKLVGSILVPGAIGLATYYLTAAVNDRAIVEKQVETAIKFLQSPSSNEIPILKNWALDKVTQTLKLPADARQELPSALGAVTEPHPPDPALIAKVKDGLQGNEKKWMTIAISQIGIPNDTRIKEYLATVQPPPADSIIWHTEFVNWVMTSAGYTAPNSPLARSWLTWGASSDERVGAITVLSRDDSPVGGTVGFFVGGDKDSLILLGNFYGQVTTTTRPRRLLLGFRWPST